MRVACDFDGTLVRLMDYVVAYQTTQGHDSNVRDFTTWDAPNATPERAAHFRAALDLLDAMPRLRGALEPYDAGTGYNLAAIVSIADTSIVTANDAKATDGIALWLRANAPLAYGQTDIHCLGRRGPSKASLGYDVIIDDSPCLAEECPTIRRFRTWDEALRLVRVAAIAKRDGTLQGPVLLLANARWNEAVLDRGSF